MSKNIVELSKRFIEIKSNPENTKELEAILELALEELSEFKIKRFDSEGVKSVLVYNSSEIPERFKIILNAHLDVIPGKDFQYLPIIEGDRLYGVGSMDMKANAVCLIAAFREVANLVDYPLAIQLVTDEEIGGFNGTKYQISEGVRADFVIAGEPTNFNIANKARGILLIKISCKGVTAHGAYPWRGENALWKINDFLNRLKLQYPIPSSEGWVTTVNLAKIGTSNYSFNKIPDDGEVLLDVRYIPEDKDKIIDDIKGLLDEDFEFEVVENEAALQVDSDNYYLQSLKKVVEEKLGKEVRVYGAQGASDVRHYAAVGCDGIEFGPIGDGIGTDKEWVSISSLEDYVKIIKAFLLGL
jgi:succinyl-diaminopimelate desuccinylase